MVKSIQYFAEADASRDLVALDLDLEAERTSPGAQCPEPLFLKCCALVFEAKTSFVCGMVF